MVNARTGGGLSLLIGRAFSTPAAPKNQGRWEREGFDARGKLVDVFDSFLNPGEESTEILFGCVGFYYAPRLR